MDETISRYFFLAGGVPFVLLGSIHAALTVRDIRRPVAFSPPDQALREAMRASPLLLTARTNMWLAWIGFNLSHGVGAAFFGVVLLLAGRSQGEFDRQAALFLPLGIAMSTTYLLLAVRFWYRDPAIGITLGVICLLLSGAARAAGW